MAAITIKKLDYLFIVVFLGLCGSLLHVFSIFVFGICAGMCVAMYDREYRLN